MHGKVSHIRHDGRGCFLDLPQGIKCTRYHSLSASLSTLPPTLAITATTEESGVIMGVRHRKFTLEAVQYHPESILSESGDGLLKNFLSLNGGLWQDNPTYKVLDQALPALDIAALSDKIRASTSAKGPTILERIYAQRLKDVEVAKVTPGTTPADIQTLLSMNLAPPLTSFLNRVRYPAKKPALMAEIKRASPSKGDIALNANAAQQALTYALSGASVISVLTEPTWFKGSLLDMRLARQAIDHLPERPAILRKEFILDEYQIAEARLHGADTVLLIVAMLPDERLKSLYAYSLTLGMEPLVEVNNASEMERALALGAKVIGVNNRNLHDFNVDMGTTTRLADMVREKEVVLCALSGIKDPSDVKTYLDQGVGAVLVGEALMRATDTRAFIRQLLDWPEPEGKGKAIETVPLVKICGITTEDEAWGAMDAGADILGLVFVPSSKRHVSLERAQKISAAIHRTRLSQPLANLLTGDNVTNERWFATHARRLSTALSAPDSPSRPLLVGVFQNQQLATVLQTVAAVRLDVVQLHGSEPVEWCKHIPVPVIRAFHVDAEGSGLRGLTQPGLNEFVLLDAVRPGAADSLSGGSGTLVDWELARKVVERGEAFETEILASLEHPANGSSQVKDAVVDNGDQKSVEEPMPIILAGGLSPENVAEAVAKVRPWAVDVSGGVENDDGRGKDLEKVKAFVQAVKSERVTV